MSLMKSLWLTWRRALAALFLAVWLGALFSASALLWRYKETPGEASALRAWPAASLLALAPDVPTLLFFAHPKCPCTRAGLSELRALMSRFAGRVHAYVVFLHPNGTAADWLQTDIWSEAASIEGATLFDDQEGREADLFDARTSGQVYLFAAQGALLFNSGITPARGHEGDSLERDALIALLDNTPTRQTTIAGPVYGCSMRESE